jgi:hypothetical protein
VVPLLLALALGAIAVASDRARADVDGDRFSRSLGDWLVQLTMPKNWRPSEERTYPSILLSLSRREPPGAMLLTGERLTESLDARAYAERAAASLSALRFAVKPVQLHSQTGAYWFDFDNGTAFLRQALLVVGNVGYALTLAAPDSRTRGQHLRAFDYTLRTITIQRQARAVAPAADAGPIDQP